MVNARDTLPQRKILSVTSWGNDGTTSQGSLFAIDRCTMWRTLNEGKMRIRPRILLWCQQERAFLGSNLKQTNSFASQKPFLWGLRRVQATNTFPTYDRQTWTALTLPNEMWFLEKVVFSWQHQQVETVRPCARVVYRLETTFGELWRVQLRQFEMPGHRLKVIKIQCWLEWTVNTNPKARLKYATVATLIYPHISSPENKVVNNRPENFQAQMPKQVSKERNVCPHFFSGNENFSVRLRQVLRPMHQHNSSLKLTDDNNAPTADNR